MRPPACRGPHRSPAHWLDLAPPQWRDFARAVDGYVPFVPDVARRSAEALIAECRRLGRFDGAADGAELILP